MSKPVHYRGDTFELVARIAAVVNGAPVSDFTGYTLASQIRDPKGNLIANLTAVWSDASQGVAILTAPSSAAWPLTTAKINVRVTAPGGKVISSDSAFFEIEESPTR